MDQTCKTVQEQVIKTVPEFLCYLEKIGLLLERVEKFVHETKSKLDRNKILLCMSQIQKVLPLLIDVYSKNDRHSFEFKEISRYLRRRVDWCLDETERVLNGEHDDEKEDCFGQFVHRIDMALQILSGKSEINVSKPEDWKPVVEDLLCQALTIAGISGGIDAEEITASCHKVLREFGRLESDQPLVGVSSLHFEILADWLLQLERRVNTALLRLVLKAYSDPQLPMKALVTMVKSEKSVRSPSDLDTLIDDLDFHNDCLQHVALFALACSEDSKRVLKIRCCLASLESLDDNLVPAVVASYLDPSHPGKKQLVRFLVSHWKDEVESMQVYLDRIIDPVAFSAITLESVEQLLDDVKTKLLVDSSEFDVGTVRTIIRQAEKLGRHLDESDSDTKIKKQLHSITNECDCSLKMWIGKHAQNADRPMTINRIMKRIELLVTTLRKISTQLSANLAMKNNSYENTSSLLADVSFPETIRDVPIDISSNASLASRKIGQGDILQKICFANFQKLKNRKKENKEETDDDDEVNVAVLEPYVSRATEKTPFKNTFYAPSPRRLTKKKETPLTVISKKQKSVVCDESLNSSLALDITDILENLDDSEDGTLSTVDYSIDSCKKDLKQSFDRSEGQYSLPDLSGIVLIDDSEWKSAEDVNTYVEQTDVSSIVTIERLNDLQRIQEKIDYLKNCNFR